MGNSPSLDKNEFWFPYWVKIRGKEKYGQFAPMIGQKGLLQLLQEAINQDFFSSDFLSALNECIIAKIEKQNIQVRDKFGAIEA